MKNILDKKVTGKQFADHTWGEFAQEIKGFFLGYCRRPIVFYPAAALQLKKGGTISFGADLQVRSFGRGDERMGLLNNLNELKGNYQNMDGVFYIETKDRSRTYRTKLPKEVMDIFISQL